MGKKNKSGYVYHIGEDQAQSARNKKFLKNQASTGSTVEQPKKKITIIQNKANKEPRPNPLGVDAALGRSIKADRGFIHKWGKKVMAAQKREDFIDRLPKSAGSVKSGIGGFFGGVSSAIGQKITDHKAKVELRETAYYKARKAARGAWDSVIKPTNKAEQAVQY